MELKAKLTSFGSTMTPDFFNLSYLEKGSIVQQSGLEAIRNVQVLEILKDFDPVLAGTLPLDLFVENSDLDILCFTTDLKSFETLLKKKFGMSKGFVITSQLTGNISTVIANFYSGGFQFEIFAQPVPTREQSAYRHLVNEYTLLQKNGPDFREKILALKKQGTKTEPAFAKVMGLSGDPYASLLQIE